MKNFVKMNPKIFLPVLGFGLCPIVAGLWIWFSFAGLLVALGSLYVVAWAAYYWIRYVDMEHELNIAQAQIRRYENDNEARRKTDHAEAWEQPVMLR